MNSPRKVKAIRPLGESESWRGPIVMNSEEELRLAFAEYAQGSFLKHKAAGLG